MLPIRFDEEYYPVPAAAQDADPAADMRDLFFRLSTAESSLQESELERRNDLQELLLGLIELSDQVLSTVEEADVPDTETEDRLINALVAFGQSIRQLLALHRVEAIVTIGMPFDPDLAQVVDYVPHARVPSGTVLREQRVGYQWPGGVLRKAQVAIAGSPPVDVPGEQRPDDGDAPGGYAPVD